MQPGRAVPGTIDCMGGRKSGRREAQATRMAPPPRLSMVRRLRTLALLAVPFLLVLGLIAEGYRVAGRVTKPVSQMIEQQVARPTEVPPPVTELPSSSATPVPAPVASPTATPLPTLSGTRRINVLLLGSDTDAKFKEEVNTQIVMVVSIDPVHHQVTLLSIPRDFWIPVPGKGMQKLQLAYRYGGVSLVRETVENDFGITIDHYAWIGLEGFEKVIDVAGGVNVDVTHPVIDDQYPDDLHTSNPYAYKRLYIQAGPQHLTGGEALEYVRSRHGDLIGDFGRSQRQQQVLLKLRRRLEQPGTILQIPDYLDAISGSIRSDFSLRDIISLATFGATLQADHIQQVVLQPPAYSELGWSDDGQSIVAPHWPEVRAKVREIFRQPNDPILIAPTSTVGYRVSVQNATGTPLLGARAVTYLKELGYTVLPAQDATIQNVQRSTIIVRNANLVAEVQPLAALFHAQTEIRATSDTEDADVVVMLGRNHGSFEGLS